MIVSNVEKQLLLRVFLLVSITATITLALEMLIRIFVRIMATATVATQPLQCSMLLLLGSTILMRSLPWTLPLQSPGSPGLGIVGIALASRGFKISGQGVGSLRRAKLTHVGGHRL